MTAFEWASGATSLTLYLWVTALIARSLRTNAPLENKAHLIIGPCATVTHIAFCVALLYTPNGLFINLSSVLALFGAVLTSASAIALLNKNARLLGLLSYPLAAFMMLISLLTFDDSTQPIRFENATIAHILLSLIAYSVLALTMTQAVALSFQIRVLKHTEHRRWVGHLPPLQTMEHTLFKLLLIGWLILSAAIGTGWFFVGAPFSEAGLPHKTILSIMSWVVLGTLLIGHKLRGWRGEKAARWVIAGFCLLFVAYFGSKFVLEVILNR